jgi:hypothetical protein
MFTFFKTSCHALAPKILTSQLVYIIINIVSLIQRVYIRARRDDELLSTGFDPKTLEHDNLMFDIHAGTIICIQFA